MREDMAKVIVERPRIGGGGRFPRGAGRARRPDDLPKRQGMRQPWAHWGRCKWLNENLAPLRRYLQSNVGRPWDKVFADICQRINFDSAVQLHIWQHVKQYVCIHAIRTPAGYTDSRGRSVCEAFVVAPKSGLLRKNERSYWWRRYHYGREAAPPDNNRVRIDDTHVCRRINGIWYELELRPVPPGGAVLDAVTHQPVREMDSPDLEWVGGVKHYAATKKQLNSRAIRRLSLPTQT